MKGCADPPAVTQPAASHPLSGPGGLGPITGHHLKACPLGPLEGWARPRPCSGGDPCPEPRCLLIRRGRATSLRGQLSEGSDLALPGSRQPGRSAACRSRCSRAIRSPGGHVAGAGDVFAVTAGEGAGRPGFSQPGMGRPFAAGRGQSPPPRCRASRARPARRRPCWTTRCAPSPTSRTSAASWCSWRGAACRGRPRRTASRPRPGPPTAASSTRWCATCSSPRT